MVKTVAEVACDIELSKFLPPKLSRFYTSDHAEAVKEYEQQKEAHKEAMREIQDESQEDVYKRQPIDRIVFEHIAFRWSESDIAGNRLFPHRTDFLYSQSSGALFFGLLLQGLQLFLLSLIHI